MMVRRWTSQKMDPKAPPPPTPIKALHININIIHQGVNQSRIKHLYSLSAMVFPLGINMRFVHNYCLLTNSQAKAKVACLWAHQELFLSQMETCTMWEIASLDLEDHATKATLQQLIMNIPDLANPKSRLFYLVNKMFLNPSKSSGSTPAVVKMHEM